MTLTAKMIVSLMALLGLAALANAASRGPTDVPVFCLLAALAIVSARLKLKLPGIDGTMSMNLPFVLAAIAVLPGFGGTLVGCLSTLAQSFRTRKPVFNPIHTTFNVATMAFAAEVSRAIFARLSFLHSAPQQIGVAAFVFFFLHTFPVGLVISVTENKPLFGTFREIGNLSFAYYVLSAGVAGTVIAGADHLGWQSLMLVLPVMCGVLQSFRTYFGRIAAEALQGKLQAAAVASLGGSSAI